MRALVVFAVLLGAASARGDDRAAARRLYEAGTKHYNVGEYREALEAFKAAYFAKSDPVFLFNMGQCYRQLGEPDGAAREYRAYLRERPNAANRAEVEEFIAAAERELQRRAAAMPPTGTLAPDARAAAAAEPEARPPRRWWIVGVVAAAVVLVAGAVTLGVLLGTSRDAAAGPNTLGTAMLSF